MKYVIYAIFMTLPFANKAIFEFIYPVEIPLLFGLMVYLFDRKGRVISLAPLDWFAFAFAVAGLLSVIVGIDSFYESARFFRLLVLTPFLLYFIIRFGVNDIEILRKAVFFILPGSLWQGALLLKYYMMFGERPVGVEGAASTITLSVIFCFSLAVLLFGFIRAPKGIFRLLRYLLILLLGIMLIVSFTRASTVAFAVLAPLTAWLWRDKRRRRYVGRAAFGATLGLLVTIFSGAVLYSGQSVEGAGDIEHSVGRLFDINLYLNDFAGRVAFWGRMARVAMENPLLGSGASSFSIGLSGGTAFNLGSAHNVLISTLITTGVIGLSIFLGMVFFAYRSFLQFVEKPELDVLGKVLILTLTCTLLVALTNDLTGGRIFIWFVLLGMTAGAAAEKTGKPEVISTLNSGGLLRQRRIIPRKI